MGPTAPPVAVRRSQAASESDAAARQQVQNDDSASSNPRLVKKIVARGSWFVVRKKPAIILGWAVMKSRNGPHKAPFIGELAAKGGLRG